MLDREQRKNRFDINLFQSYSVCSAVGKTYL